MIRATLQWGSHLVGVFGALVHTRNATAMARVVVEDCLDVVRLDANLAKHCCTGTT